MAELEKWIATQVAFTIECGSSELNNGSVYVKLTAAQRSITVNSNDDVMATTYFPKDRTVGNALMQALNLWKYDGAVKRFRVHLQDPPAELAIAGSIWTPDNRVCEVTGSNEYQVRETIKWHYNNVGRDCPKDFLVQEIGLVENPNS